MRMRWILALGVLLGGSPVDARDSIPPWAKVSTAQKRAAAELEVPVAFENEYGMRFVFIPAGSFEMGGDPAQMRSLRPQLGRTPRHPVTLTRPFYLQTTETTAAQAHTVMADGDGPDAKTGGQPVRGLNWWDATRLVQTLSEADKNRRYRLPTEAEWEYACRAHRRDEWYWGDQRSASSQYENLRGSADGHSGIAPPAALKPNPFGLHDMLGNVMEWTMDRYAPLSDNEQVDPDGQYRWLTYKATRILALRVVRGGSWTDPPHRSLPWRRLGRQSEDVANVGVRMVAEIGVPAVSRTRVLYVNTLDADTGELMSPISVDLYNERRKLESSAGRVSVPIESGSDEKFDLWTRPPVGRIDLPNWRGTHFVRCRVGRAAKRHEIDIPLCRTVRVSARLSDSLSNKPEDFKVTVLPWFHRTLVKGPDKNGRILVTQIPAITGMPIRVVVNGLGLEGEARTTVSYGVSTIRLDDPIVLGPPPPPPERPESYGVSEGSSLVTQSPSDPTGRVLVRCQDAQGRPIRDALVVRDAVSERDGFLTKFSDVAFCDDEGVATFLAVPKGDSHFELLGWHAPWVRVHGQVHPFQTLQLELTTPAAARVNLHVRREEGGVAAWARVKLTHESDRKWVDLRPDGVVRVNPRLDHTGAHTLENIEPGEATINVSFIGRTLNHRVKLEPGETRTLHLTLLKSKHWASGKPPR